MDIAHAVQFMILTPLTRPDRAGYTLRDLLFVVTGICVLLAICVPFLQAVRERSRRMICPNNLKNITLALQNYHDVYRQFPMGAMHAGIAAEGDPPVYADLGPSWWWAIVPFMEQRDGFYREPWHQRPGSARCEFTASDMLAAGMQAVILSTGLESMRCPASPLPATETPTGPILLPSYVGIAGGCDIDPTAFEYRYLRRDLPDIVLPGWRTLYHNQAKGTGAAAGGIVTTSGMLPPCQFVRLRDCTDGLSNTMIVAEQSDWLLDRNPASRRKYRGDAGWTVGGTGAAGGFLSGTRRVDPVPPVAVAGGPPSVWGADCWNLTVVRYPPNRKRVLGPSPLPGCSENHGINNPLQSPHHGGVFVAMVDGSVQFISDDTDLDVLLRLAIRDDNAGFRPAPTAPAEDVQ